MWLIGGVSALLHGGVLGLLFLLAALAPSLDERLIPVRLLKHETPEDAAPAPKVLAERRLPNFAPQVQAVAPQIVNPRVIAHSSPALKAEALQMDSVSSVVAPTQIVRSTMVVERVSAVNSPIAARATAVDVSGIGVPLVINRVGSMMTGFFSDGPVTDYESAARSDTERYAKFFHGMLSRGVYLAPSQFEAMFVSLAHGEAELAATAEATEASMADLARS